MWQIHEDDLSLAYALCSVSTLSGWLSRTTSRTYLGAVITKKLVLGEGAADLKKHEYWDQDTEAVAMEDLEMQPLKPDLRAELESMRVGALRSRAQHDGIDAEKIEHALDAEMASRTRWSNSSSRRPQRVLVRKPHNSHAHMQTTGL